MEWLARLYKLPADFIETIPWQSSEDERLQYVWQRVREDGANVGIELEEFNTIHQFSKSQMHRLLEYSVQLYSGKVVILTASECENHEGAHDSGDERAVDQDWRPWIKGAIDVIGMPGSHESMVFPPCVDTLARTILSFTDSSTAAEAGEMSGSCADGTSSVPLQ